MSESHDDPTPPELTGETTTTQVVEVEEEQDDVRLYVADTNNYGHQATAITLLFRLIELEYRRIRVVYSDANEGHPMWPKLATLVPGLPDVKPTLTPLKDEPVGVEVSLLGATVIFSEYLHEFASPLTQKLHGTPDVPLVVCGGFDSTDSFVPKGPRVAVFMHGALFLCLQPCQWTELEAQHAVYYRAGSGVEKVDLATKTMLGDEFPWRGYALRYRSNTDLGGPKCVGWTHELLFPGYSPQFLHCLKLDVEALERRSPSKLALLLQVLDLVRAGKVDLCPGYFSPGRAAAAASAELLQYIQTKGPKYAKSMLGLGLAGKPRDHVPVVNLVAALAWSSVQRKAGRATLVTILAKLTEEEVLAAAEWLAKAKLALEPERVVVLTKPTYEGLAEACATVGPGGVIVLPLGSVDPGVGLPRTLFDHLFGLATLPCFFEGKGTLNLALNLGKPYLTLRSIDLLLGIPTPGRLYPIHEEGDDALGSRLESGRHLLEAEPGEFVKAGHDATLGALLLDALDPEHELAKYFARLGAFYGDPANDKLELAHEYCVETLLPWLAQQEEDDKSEDDKSEDDKSEDDKSEDDKSEDVRREDDKSDDDERPQ